MECLRLVAMMMVLVLHADYAALGAPIPSLWIKDVPQTCCRVLFEQMALPAVNCFVLISGWFGIRTSFKSIASLTYQVLFYALIVLAVVVWLPEQVDSKVAMLSFIPGYHHWFIRSYLGLMLFAPLINKWLKDVSTSRLIYFLIAFFSFQSIYGWIIGADGFNRGYSVLSFIGLYILGALARRQNWQEYGSVVWMCIYVGCVLLATAWTLIALANGFKVPLMTTAYDSPITILGALALTMTFAAGKWHNKRVNHIAQSALAVYLLHFSPFLFQRFLGVCRNIYKELPYFESVMLTALFLLAVFMASILIDRVRLLSWKFIANSVKGMQ